MKTTLFFAFIAISSIVTGQFSKDEIKSLKKSVKAVGAAGRYDRYNHTFNVVSGAIKFSESSIFLYFEVEKSDSGYVKKDMKMKIIYNGSSWLFMDEISIAMGFMKDGDEDLRTSAIMPIGEGSRNVNSNATVTEISVEYLNKEMYDILRYLSVNKRFCTIKISGSDSYVDYGIFGTSFTKNFKGVFAAYEDLGFL